MKCPADKIDMVEKQGDGFNYHECPTCSGIWMRHRALRMLVEEYNPNADFVMPRPQHAFGTLHNGADFDTNDITKCPIDGSDYYEHSFGSVVMDICPECDGIWLDSGELEKVTQELKELDPANIAIASVMSNVGAFFGRWFSANQ